MALYAYSMRVESGEAGQDVAARLAESRVEGPMRSPRTQMIADSMARLLQRDRRTVVRYSLDEYGDPTSNMQNADHLLFIGTKVPQPDFMQTFRASEAAMIQTVKAAGGEYN